LSLEPTINPKPLKTWSDAERISAVKNIFKTITPSYDLLNRIMSGRRDVSWRRFAVTRIPANATRILDVATGTGDLAIDLTHLNPGLDVIGLDFVQEMMILAKLKTSQRKLTERIAYVGGDATRLPFSCDQFDAATIAFGLRNIPDRRRALYEMARVVKPGGKVIVLEMTFPKSLKLRGFFTWYLNHVIPFVGRLISGDLNAYRYLPDSIQDFLNPNELEVLLNQVGIKSVKSFPLTFGLTYVHEGVVP
jgi:demethylmenaquinone methyltransferase / 2-methoxy-6-polyprenyl-1,4-benzoquinol methylase